MNWYLTNSKKNCPNNFKFIIKIINITIVLFLILLIRKVYYNLSWNDFFPQYKKKEVPKPKKKGPPLDNQSLHIYQPTNLSCRLNPSDLYNKRIYKNGELVVSQKDLDCGECGFYEYKIPGEKGCIRYGYDNEINRNENNQLLCDIDQCVCSIDSFGEPSKCSS